MTFTKYLSVNLLRVTESSLLTLCIDIEVVRLFEFSVEILEMRNLCISDPDPTPQRSIFGGKYRVLPYARNFVSVQRFV